MEDLKNMYISQFLNILEPSNNLISGNKIKEWYLNFCNKILNVYEKKWIVNNRQDFIGRLRDEYSFYEKINKKTSRSLGWMLKVNDQYVDVVTNIL